MKNELYHHGILGMKWGVRRYQNADGSYTQEGLRRYRKSEESYNQARQRYTTAREGGDKQQIKSARADLKTAKRYLSEDYDQLKRDCRADKGKKLYENGKTITSNGRTLELMGGATTVGAAVAYAAINRVYGATVATVSASAIATGGAAATAALGIIKERQNNQLRAYYGHSRPKHH